MEERKSKIAKMLILDEKKSEKSTKPVIVIEYNELRLEIPLTVETD